MHQLARSARAGDVRAALGADTVLQGRRQQHRRRLGQPAMRGHDRFVDSVQRRSPASHRAARGARPDAAPGPPASPAVYCSASRCIGAAPEPGHRRQVVGGDRRHRRTRPGLGLVGLEVEQPVGQDLPLGQRLAYAVLDRAEVLPHHDRLRSMRLERDDVEQVLAGVADVGAVGRARRRSAPTRAGTGPSRGRSAVRRPRPWWRGSTR